MKYKIIVPIIFGTLLLLSACSFSKENINSGTISGTSVGNETQKSEITIIQNNRDLGEIPMNKGKVKIPFEFINTGNTNIVLADAETSCMCTEGIVSNLDGNNPSGKIKMRGHAAIVNVGKTVKPGEKLLLTAIYDPNAHGPDATGPISRDIYIQTNSKEIPVLKFNFIGNVVK